MSSWQPIETAPEGNGQIIGLLKSGRACTIKRSRRVVYGPIRPEGGCEVIGEVPNGWCEVQSDALMPATPTHWMPLESPRMETGALCAICGRDPHWPDCDAIRKSQV